MNNKQKAEKIFLDRKFQIREHSIRNMIGDFLLPKKPHVTAIGTSGGKTFTTAGRLELLYKHGFIKSNESVLILAADKTILRGNFVEQFTEFFKDIPASFTWRAVANKKELRKAVSDKIQVIITLPQTINDSSKLELLKKHKVTWFIQDEAHRWYFKKTIQRMLKTLKPKHQSLLTGTPFKFNAKSDEFIFDYTPVAEMYEKGYLSDMEAQVLHSSVELTKIDYVSLLGNLKETKRFGESEVINLFNEVVNDLIKKLKLPYKGLTTTHNVTNNISSVFGKLQKTIIFTHGTSEANYLQKYLETTGVKSLISHSKLKVDDAEKTFDDFKTDDDVKILVAVNRGKEGFDFQELYNVIDMTYSQNFEVVMQIIGRILRKSPNIKNKYFFKVAPKHTAGYFTDWMNALFMLFEKEWYSKYNGKNGFDIRIPNTLLKQNRKQTQPTSSNKGKSKKGNFKPQNIEHFNSLQFMKDNKWFKLDDSISTVASTSLLEIVRMHGNNKKPFYTMDRVISDLKKIKNYTELRENFSGLHKYILRNNLIDLTRKYIDMKTYDSFNNMITVKDAIKTAKKSKITRVRDFIKEYPTEYHILYKNGYDYTGNIKKEKPVYTKENLFKYAKEVKTISEFRKKYAGGPKRAKELGIYEDLKKYWKSEHSSKFVRLKKKDILEAQKHNDTANGCAKYLNVGLSTYKREAQRFGVYKCMSIAENNKRRTLVY